MIKPTVGRIVWYRQFAQSDPTDAGMAGWDSDEPLAAMICGVQDENTVNLAVFDANGGVHVRLRVPLFQGDGEAPRGGFCEWPEKEASQEDTETPYKPVQPEIISGQNSSVDAGYHSAIAASAPPVEPPPFVPPDEPVDEQPARPVAEEVS